MPDDEPPGAQGHPVHREKPFSSEQERRTVSSMTRTERAMETGFITPGISGSVLGVLADSGAVANGRCANWMSVASYSLR
jgi:hypothetical protein